MLWISQFGAWEGVGLTPDTGPAYPPSLPQQLLNEETSLASLWRKPVSRAALTMHRTPSSLESQLDRVISGPHHFQTHHGSIVPANTQFIIFLCTSGKKQHKKEQMWESS